MARWYDETPPKPIRVFVPGTNEPSHEVTGRSFTVRVRGARGEGHVTHSYRCPEHGLFDAKVPRSSVPDDAFCPHDRCGLSSPWAGSMCGIGWAAGEVTG